MKKEDKLKKGNSLETQFWSDEVEIDKNSPFMQYMNKIWNLKEENYIPTEKEKNQLEKDIKEYYKDSTQ